MTVSSSQRISVIIPLYNEAGSLPDFSKRILSVLESSGYSYELIFIDDGSDDGSLPFLKNLQKQNSFIKYLSLSRNFGHQVALTAGLDAAKGDAVIMMDADLQHPPEMIPELINKWKEGYDVVYTVRRPQGNIAWAKKTSSKLFYWILKKITKIEIHAGAADFRLLSRRAADSLKEIKERDRFLRGLVSWIGFSQIGVEYDAGSRLKGNTKYSIRKMVRLGLDGMTSFSSVPLYFSTILGFIVSVASFIHALFVLYWKFFTDETVQGWTTIVLMILFLGGVQLICLGIIGEYIGRIYVELKARPLYFVKESGGLT